MTKKTGFKITIGLLLLYLGYLLYVFFLSPKTNLQSIYLVPKDAVFILESDRPVEAWRSISESKAWPHLTKNAYFSELTESIQRVDTIFKNQRKLFKQLDGRSLYISVHMVSPKQYGIFYVLDLKRIAKLKLLKTYFNTLLNDDYVMSKRNYHGHEVLELLDKTSKETIYLTFIKNQMIASYTHALVEAAIDQYQEPVIGRDLNFLAINEKVGFEDLFRLYVQYPYIDDYVKCFADQPQDWVKQLSENFRYSGFHLDFKDNLLTAQGYTNINANKETYLRALQQSGTAKRTIAEMAPSTTAMYLSYGFEEFAEFYQNFETLLQEDPERFNTYQKSIATTEKFLKIDVKEHFLSWIGNEIGLLQLQSKIAGQQNNMALVLKTKDITKAQTNLDFILKQIKKRTPVKFKAVNFKGHQINFLSIKGFFKMILGARFNAFDKPYFTVIRDFVVFSNNPNTLKSIITDFEEGNTLVNAAEFQRFDRRFDQESSLFLYGNIPLAYNNLYEMMDAQTKAQMRKNKDFIVCFPEFGFQLTPKDHLFKSTLVTYYTNVANIKANPYFFAQATKSTTVPKPTPEGPITEAVFKLPTIYPTDLNAKVFAKKYPNGTLRYQVDLKDGLKHGSYEAFYANGTKKMTGRFKADKQVGTWRYFDQKGEQLLKKRF